MESSSSSVSPYPHGLTLQRCRRAVSGRPEFRETSKGRYVVLNYDYCFGATFPDPAESGIGAEERENRRVRRECRGIVFDAHSGAVVARRLHKFFNVDEREETALHRIDWSREHEVTEKMDGAMISSLPIDALHGDTDGASGCTGNDDGDGGDDDGEGDGVGHEVLCRKLGVQLATKNGPTALSQAAQQTLLERGMLRNVLRFCKQWLDLGYTALFEWCSPEHRIVLQYDEPMLVLIALRHIESGRYLTHAEMTEAAGEYNVSVVSLVDVNFAEADDVQQLMHSITERKQVEGCVVRFVQGDWYKIKSEWYFAQSKAHMALPKSERELWAALLGNRMDDVYPKLTPEVRREVDDFSQRLTQRLQHVAQQQRSVVMASLWKEQEQWERKDWVARLKQEKSLSKVQVALFLNLFDAQQDEHVALRKVAAKMCTTKSFKAMREALDLQDLNFHK